MLRKKTSSAKFVDFTARLEQLPVADRTTIGTCAGIRFDDRDLPIDAQTLTYLRLTGRSDEQGALVEAYAKAQGMFRTDAYETALHRHARLDMSIVEAEPCRTAAPQDRVPLKARAPRSKLRSMSGRRAQRVVARNRTARRLRRRGTAVARSSPSKKARRDAARENSATAPW